MKKQRCGFWCILLMAVIIAICAAMPVSYAATISGTVYNEDGTSPVNDTTIAVNLYEGTPCGPHQVVAQNTTSNGGFVIAGISPGVYYLKTEKVFGTSNCVNEWWAGAGSIWDCWGAEAITINSSADVLTDKNFQLDLYGSISGSVYDANGIPMTESQILCVSAIRGSSCQNSDNIDSFAMVGQPSYRIRKVPPGTYYVKSFNNSNSVWYVEEYHTVSGNTNNGISYLCSSATQVTVNSGMDTPNIDFQLDGGGRISGTVFKSVSYTHLTLPTILLV